MSRTDIHVDLSAVNRRRWTWASGDYSVIAARIALMAEQLPSGQAVARAMRVPALNPADLSDIAVARCRYVVNGSGR